MFCKKHGEIDRCKTVTFMFPTQPYIKIRGKDVLLEPYDDGGRTFCNKCIVELLEEKIGVVTEKKIEKRIRKRKTWLRKLLNRVA